jgi:tRNA modification GTPase
VVHPETGELLDEVLYLAFREPASYTGEDVVEITTHGGLLAPAEVLTALLAAGARAATPGEFTRRALANGKVDLLQAEATADIIDATAPAQRRAALRQLDRGLSQRVASLRDRVLELEALVSYDIDFPEEDDGPVAPAQIDNAVGALQALLGDLLGTAAEGERLREGALCVIAGAPNTGKSSLFNAMIGDERAIVTEIAGTTRDAIEAAVTCGGYPFRLIDTAGLREDGDRIERLGIEVSRRYLDAADVILFCVESGKPISEHESLFAESADAPVLVVRTKSDTVVGRQAPDGLDEALNVSAHTGEGLQDLRDGLARLAFAGLSGATDLDAVVTRERHRIALVRALEEVDGFAAARAGGLEAAVAATHLRAAVTALEDIIGLVTSDDVLDRVFASFCVGK